VVIYINVRKRNLTDACVRGKAMSEKITRIAIHVLVRNDTGEILLHRRQNTWAEGRWDCPSGKLEYNELIEETAERELREETGLSCQKFRFLGAHSVKDGFHKPTQLQTDSYVYIPVEAVGWEGTPKIMEPKKCSEMRWFKIDEAKKLPLTLGAWYILNKCNLH